MSEQQDVAEALAREFDLAAARDSGRSAELRRFEGRAERRCCLVARAGGVSLRHGHGWTLVVATDADGRPTRAEVTGQYPPPSVIDRLRRADQRTGGLLSAALGRGRNRHTRFVVRALRGG